MYNFSLKLVRYKNVLTILFLIVFFSNTHFVSAQSDSFDLGNVYDNFDDGNMDPNNPVYDWDNWSASGSGPVSTPQDSGPGLGACGAKIERLQDLLTLANCYISTGFVPIIFTLAFGYFVWGVIKYVISDSEKDKAKGRQFMIWGIVALFAMVSVWGLVRVIGNTFGIGTQVLPLLPE
ncbi:MAG: hypothetical protein QG669_331 [Patescibacteria group bacterium]|jgi:hypothetical protein|nr:hypothetical protein [Patescibacteria group bacterium]